MTGDIKEKAQTEVEILMHSKRGRNTNLYTMACGDLNREKKRF
jgi:hypothetical protein